MLQNVQKLLLCSSANQIVSSLYGGGLAWRDVVISAYVMLRYTLGYNTLR